MFLPREGEVSKLERGWNFHNFDLKLKLCKLRVRHLLTHFGMLLLIDDLRKTAADSRRSRKLFILIKNRFRDENERREAEQVSQRLERFFSPFYCLFVHRNPSMSVLCLQKAHNDCLRSLVCDFCFAVRKRKSFVICQAEFRPNRFEKIVLRSMIEQLGLRRGG